MFILFLFVSFVSFRQCKVTAISDCFQEILQILLKLVWTNERSLDILQKWAKKLSKGALKIAQNLGWVKILNTGFEGEP